MVAQVAVRKYVLFEEEVVHESGLEVSPALRRIVVGAVAANPLAGASGLTDVATLVEVSEVLG